MTEITAIKKLISSFNMGRVKIWSHKDTIKNYNSGKPTIAKVKLDQINTLKENDTKIRLSSKAKPYGEDELDEICLRSYDSSYIQELCEEWKNDPNILNDLNDKVNNVIENLKIEFARLQRWDNMKIADPENSIKLEASEINDEVLDSLIKDKSETIDWGKACHVTRHTSTSPPINLENINDVEPSEINICPSDVTICDKPSNRLSVLTSYYDHKTDKWYEANRASHPFISVDVTKINPMKRNKCEDYTANLHIMADSGAMCSLLNYDAVRATQWATGGG